MSLENYRFPIENTPRYRKTVAVSSPDCEEGETISDVVGNKEDAPVTEVGFFGSLMAYLKGALTWLAVPPIDSQANDSIKDVIGNKSDTSVKIANNPSIMNFQKGGYYHVHSQARVYPSLADAVSVTSVATAWTLGNFFEIIPANTITKAFDIHWIIVTNMASNDEYEMVLYKGAINNTTEIGRVCFFRSSNFVQEGNLPIQVPIIPPNSRISARLANKSASARTVDVKLYYHDYPDT